MIVSDAQLSDSAMHKHVSVLSQAPLPSRLPHKIEQSSLCYSVGPCWLSILNIAVCTCQSQTPNLFPISLPSSLITIVCSLSIWVCFVNKFICIIFLILHISDIIWYLSFSSLSIGFPGGSDGRESTCNAGDPSPIPGWGRSPREVKILNLVISTVTLFPNKVTSTGSSSRNVDISLGEGLPFNPLQDWGWGRWDSDLDNPHGPPELLFPNRQSKDWPWN